jgi:hypothetical protein
MIMQARSFVLFTLLTACGSSSAPPADAGTPDAGTTPDAAGDAPLVLDLPGEADAPSAPDAAGDLPPSADAATDLLSAGSVKFILRNETGKTIYIQQGGFWTLARAGMRLNPEDGCGVCNCDAPGCAVCGKALDVALPLDPGAMQTWQWNGLNWAVRPGGKNLGGAVNIDCEYPEAVAAGPLTVVARYSFTKEDRPPESLVGPTVAVEQTFQFPPAGDVVLVAR